MYTTLLPDPAYLREVLRRMLAVPSPSGMTDEVVHVVCDELNRLGVHFELTRRGAIRATLPGQREGPIRGIVSHLDTLGAMVRELGENGRPMLAPIGTWSSRFAEGARVTLFCDGGRRIRGTILPKLASGHAYGDKVDDQPGGWDNVELRLDLKCESREGLVNEGIHVGDVVAVDSNAEFNENGFINARHLDDKAGASAMLAAVRTIMDKGITPIMPSYLLFTISEEVGVGASHILHGGVSELVSVDNGANAPGQNTSLYGATIAMMDSSGPFDRHLTRELLDLCQNHDITHTRDVFRHYRSDAAAALEAGNDIRAALVCFALDASHGHERTHMDSLLAVGTLLAQYICRPPLFERDRADIGPLEDFPHLEHLETQWPHEEAE